MKRKAVRGNSSVNGSPRSDRKVLAIASAAEKLFSDRGYVETSMEDVASSARISKGGMYHYFGSKPDLLYFVLSRFMGFVLERVEEDAQQVENPIDRLRFIIFRHVRIYTDHVCAAKVLLNEAHNLPSPMLAEIKSKERRYFAVISRALSSCLGDRIDKDKLTVTTFGLLGMCNWIYSWYNPAGAVDPAHLSQIIFDTFLHGLLGLRKDRGQPARAAGSDQGF